MVPLKKIERAETLLPLTQSYEMLRYATLRLVFVCVDSRGYGLYAGCPRRALSSRLDRVVLCGRPHSWPGALTSRIGRYTISRVLVTGKK